MDANLLAQFGDNAPAIQALLQAVIQPLQQQIDMLNQQLNQAPQQLNAQIIADAVAQGIAQFQPVPAVPAPAPAPAPAPQQPAVREPKVADPPTFSGDRNQLTSFIRAVRTCFQLNPSRFPAGMEAHKILFALGFIQGGTAGTWANNHANAMLHPNTPDPFATFEEFQTALERSFGSLDRAQKARTDMGNLRMKPGDTVEEYTTAFEALAVHTGYNEAAHIELYRSGLLSRILEKIYGDSNGQLPIDLNAWKTKARHLDNLYHELRSLQLRNTTSTSNQQKPRPNPPRAPVPTTIATPTTASSAPEAMDVDGHRRSIRCFNCGKFGHISRNCPEPRRNRSIRYGDVGEIVRAVIAETKTREVVNTPVVETTPPPKEDFPQSQQ